MELLRERRATMAATIKPQCHPRCAHEIGFCWEESSAQYAASMKAAAANGMKGWEHASCDHAEGYCAASATNVFQGV
jgi:hypothetical protein